MNGKVSFVPLPTAAYRNNPITQILSIFPATTGALSWSIVVTEQGPGIYMYLMKQPDGRITEMVFTHTDEGVNINQKEPATGLSASYSMRRSPDWEGTWKMVASPGLGNLLGACGE